MATDDGKKKRRIVGRILNLGADKVDKGLEKLESRDAEGSFKDALREERGESQALRREAIEQLKYVEALDRRRKEIETKMEDLFTLAESAEASGNNRALNDIADELDPLSQEHERILEEIDSQEDLYQQVRADAEDQQARTKEFSREAQRRIIEHKRLAREAKRLNRQLGTTADSDITSRNLQKALESQDDLRDEVSALRRARQDPLFNDRDRLAMGDDSDAAIRRIRRQLSAAGDADPNDRIAKAAGRYLAGTPAGRRALESTEPEEREERAPRAAAEPADTPDAPEADLKGKGATPPAAPAADAPKTQGPPTRGGVE